MLRIFWQLKGLAGNSHRFILKKPHALRPRPLRVWGWIPAAARVGAGGGECGVTEALRPGRVLAPNLLSAVITMGGPPGPRL